MYAGWQKDASVEPDLLGRYFVERGRNIGVVCGEAFDAWDIEVEHVPAFSAWLDRNGHALPESPTASTGRGGLHFLTKPTGVDHTRKLYLEGTHIGELKSTGGFILVCPSVTEQMYRWTWMPTNARLAEAPDFLRGLLERPVAVIHRFPSRIATPDDAIAVLGRLAAAVINAGEGSRNNYLYWAVRRAVEEGIPDRHARAVLSVAGVEAGLDADEVEKTVESALVAESVAA